jgi:hypothetical protein
VILFAPSASASAAAWATIQEKIPVVSGQANVTLCFAANTARSSLIVTTRPLGTCFISASTSNGAGDDHRLRQVFARCQFFAPGLFHF